jgi:hypothetical protein
MKPQTVNQTMVTISRKGSPPIPETFTLAFDFPMLSI